PMPMAWQSACIAGLSPTSMDMTATEALDHMPTTASDDRTGTGIDPVALLKSHRLWDATQGLPENIVRQMWALVDAPGAGAPGFDAPGAGQPQYRTQMSQTHMDPRHAHSHMGQSQMSQSHAQNHTSPADARTANFLLGVMQRHALGGDTGSALRLLHQLRSAHRDIGVSVGTRQFWATLDAQSIGDFEVLAHAAVALASAHGLGGGGAEAFEAAQREWQRGAVQPTTGAVAALLKLSEYGHLTGRAAAHWEFGQAAEAVCHRLRFRGQSFPWRSARLHVQAGRCDTEYEHVLATYWAAWTQLVQAAQLLARRLGDNGDDAPVPELPLHDACRHFARFPPSACQHAAHHAYQAATWRLQVIVAPLHAALMDVREGLGPAPHYHAALTRWEAHALAWRAAWPPQWDAQLTHVHAATAAHKPLAAADIWLLALHLAYESARLRAHAFGLALLHGPPASPNAFTGANATLSRSIVLAPNLRPEARAQRWGFNGHGFDPLGEAIVLHKSQWECLAAARHLQQLLELGDSPGVLPLADLGAWGIGIVEQIVALNSVRMTQDADSQADGLMRLARLLRLLLPVRRWAVTLYVFTSVVKAFVDDGHCVDVDHVTPGVLRPVHVASSLWPQTHVLTMLMGQMRIAPRDFCALTLPVVYAAVLATPEMPSSLRMKIESLIS
ncbi:hypothetical protein LPJ66_005420, partial [Kickxella alabastrina]